MPHVAECLCPTCHLRAAEQADEESVRALVAIAVCGSRKHEGARVVELRLAVLPIDHALDAEVDALVEAQCGKQGKRPLKRA